MLGLTDVDLGRIFGCADGPASFNAEASASGRSVVSCDPNYKFSADEIRQRIDATHPQMIDQTHQNTDEFVWSHQIPDVDALGRLRMATMHHFLADYEVGRHAGRYVAAELLALPFTDVAFDIAVCWHSLFLYSEQLFEQFHVESIRSLMRVAKEVRIFPLTFAPRKRAVSRSETRH